MYRTSNDLRKVFMRMNKAGSSAVAIASCLNVSRQTVHQWKRLDESQLLKEGNVNTRRPSLDLDSLKRYILDNPFAFDREVGSVFGRSIKTIHKWRHRLGFKRKKVKTTYLEADLESKKTLRLN